MRRFISLACVALVVFMCMVSPVSAADLDIEQRFNLLDFWLPSLISVSEGSNNISIPLPQSMAFGSFDFVVNAPGGLNSASILFNSNSYPLTLDLIDSGYYRIYGFDFNILFGFTDSITLVLDSASALYVRFISAYASYTPIIEYDIDAFCNIQAADYDKTIHFIPTDEINYRIFTATDVYNETWFTCYIWSENWRKYDYIDYQLMFDVQAITSVSAVMGSTNIDLYVSDYDNSAIEGNNYFVSMSMDLTGLNRNSSDYPMVIVMGRLDAGVLNSIDFVNCRGGIYQPELNPFMLYLNKIIKYLDLNNSFLNSNFLNLFSSLDNWFSSLSSNLNNWIINQTAAFQLKITELADRIDLDFSYLSYWITQQTASLESAIRGDTSPGDSFQQEVDQKDQQLNDMAAVMDSVSKPQIDSVNVSADTYVDQTVLATSMSGLTAVISMPVFLDVIMMALIMATAGYVLFGKR